MSEHLPRLDFTGPHQEPNLVADAANYLENRRVPLPPETQKTPELEAQLEAMDKAIVEYGHDLGLDLSSRLLGSDRIHVMDDEAMEQVYAMFPNQRGGLGMHLTSGDIIAKALPPEQYVGFLQNINHELVHQAGKKDTYLSPSESGGWSIDELRGGFRLANGEFHGIDEYYTEKISRKIVDKKWPLHPELVNMIEGGSTAAADASPDMTYDAIWRFGQQFDKKIVAELGEDAMLALEISYFTGRSEALRALDEVFGHEGIRALAALDSHHPEDIKKAATILKLPL
jgi:hypothetical protein